MTFYDSTFFANAPAAFPGTDATCIMSDRGSHGIDYRNGPRYTDIDRGRYREWLRVLPPGSTVCLDIEGVEGQDESEVVATTMYAIRAARRTRPDCTFGPYAGPALGPAYQSGDVPLLTAPELSEHQVRVRKLAPVVFQSVYPTWADRRPLAEWTPLDRAKLAAYRCASVRSCLRWVNKGTRVVPIITGTLHAVARPTGEYLGDVMMDSQLRIAKAFGGAVVWDGAAWNPDGTFKGRADYREVGVKYAWMLGAK